MSDDGRRLMLPPFPPGYRASGVLLHVSSLPSPYGIGDMGQQRWRGSTASMRQDKAGGRRCRWPYGVWQLAVSIPVVLRRQ